MKVCNLVFYKKSNFSKLTLSGPMTSAKGKWLCAWRQKRDMLHAATETNYDLHANVHRVDVSSTLSKRFNIAWMINIWKYSWPLPSWNISSCHYWHWKSDNFRKITVYNLTFFTGFSLPAVLWVRDSSIPSCVSNKITFSRIMFWAGISWDITMNNVSSPFSFVENYSYIE